MLVIGRIVLGFGVGKWRAAFPLHSGAPILPHTFPYMCLQCSPHLCCTPPPVSSHMVPVPPPPLLPTQVSPPRPRRCTCLRWRPTTSVVPSTSCSRCVCVWGGVLHGRCNPPCVPVCMYQCHHMYVPLLARLQPPLAPHTHSSCPLSLHPTPLQQLAVTIGILGAQLINFGTQRIPGFGWRISLACGAVPALMLAVGSLLLSDTPNSLVQRGRAEEARRVLERIRGTKNVDVEVSRVLSCWQARRGEGAAQLGGWGWGSSGWLGRA
jgi:hypothetical protein